MIPSSYYGCSSRWNSHCLAMRWSATFEVSFLLLHPQCLHSIWHPSAGVRLQALSHQVSESQTCFGASWSTITCWNAGSAPQRLRGLESDVGLSWSCSRWREPQLSFPALSSILYPSEVHSLSLLEQQFRLGCLFAFLNYQTSYFKYMINYKYYLWLSFLIRYNYNN